MSEEATNTQKIQTLVAKIPSLSEAWSNAIEDQNDDTISEAWTATVEHFFPDTEGLNPESVLKLLKSKKFPCKNPSDFYHPINLIADILVSLSDDFCFGEMERVLDYRPLQPEGAATICCYYIDMTKTLDGVSYCLSEEETEVESWLSSKRLSEADLVVICKDYEQEGIRSYASWTLAFSIEKLESSEKNIYSLFISHDDAFFYVEEPNSTGEYQIDPEKAFDYSSIKINRNGTWKITEGQWDKEKILQHFEWQDLNIEWLASDEDEDEDDDEDEEDEQTGKQLGGEVGDAVQALEAARAAFEEAEAELAEAEEEAENEHYEAEQAATQLGEEADDAEKAIEVAEAAYKNAEATFEEAEAACEEAEAARDEAEAAWEEAEEEAGKDDGEKE